MSNLLTRMTTTHFVMAHRSRKIHVILFSALLIAMFLASPLLVSADDGQKSKGREQIFTATAMVFVSNAGNAVPVHAIPPNGMLVKTTGEQITGCIAFSSWSVIPGANGACNMFAPTLLVDHSSLTTVNLLTGYIEGLASGTFNLNGFQGKYNAKISAQRNGQGQIISIQDNGRWHASNGTYNAEGTFNAKIDQIISLPVAPYYTLAGSVTFNGKYELTD